MKTLYIECAMGAAGDMLAAALLELLPDRAAFLEKMNGLGIPGVTVSASEKQIDNKGYIRHPLCAENA